MANAAGDALDLAIYGSHYLVTFPLLDADGDPVTGAAGLDSEVSIDLGTFADCTNEATELATSSGIYYLYLSGAEMTGKIITVRIQTSTSGAKTTVLTIHPQRMHIIATGTAQAGAGSTITLAASTSKQDNDLAGIFVRCNNNSPSGVQYQTRRIISNVASTQVATVESAWGTNPSSATTYDLLMPVTANVSAFAGTMPPSINTAGVQAVDTVRVSGTAQTAGDIPGKTNSLTFTGANKVDASLRDWLGTAPLALSSQQVQAVVPTTQKVDVETIKTNPVVNAGTITFPTTATLASTTNITSATGIDVTKIDGNATNGNNATLNLKQLNISNTAGHAIDIQASGSTHHGISIQTQTGDGIKIVPSTGHGINITSGGAGNHDIHLVNRSLSADLAGKVLGTSGGTIVAVGAWALDGSGAALAAAASLPTNFSVLGINSSGHISQVTLVDTLTTYTGDTPQTGDSFARIGAAGAGLTAVVLAATQTFNNTGTWTGNLSGTIGGLTAAGLAMFFTVDSTKLYANAVAGSVVKEIASHAAGGGGGGTTENITVEFTEIRSGG